MKIGILDAFPLDVMKINWRDTPSGAYIRFLEQVKPPFEYEEFAITQGDFPVSIDQCDAYLITGSPKGVYDKDTWITKLQYFCQNCYQSKVKMVGICFGHQILAQALGGKVEKSKKGWGIGLRRFDLHLYKHWMAEAPQDFFLNFVHQDQVIQLPPGAELLGGNDFCPNLFFTLHDQILGIQGHPEFTPELMRRVIDVLKTDLDCSTRESALKSLDQENPDTQLAAQWIVNFLMTE